jgi:hypothetical protein
MISSTARAASSSVGEANRSIRASPPASLEGYGYDPDKADLLP